MPLSDYARASLITASPVGDSLWRTRTFCKRIRIQILQHRPTRNHSRVSFAKAFSTSSVLTLVKEQTIDTHSKALRINLDPRWYGTFAEIGAGQEVVRWFFRVGGAAGTVAKSMSAYDMKVSDAIYGHADRYVSRSRLQAMLDHEFELNVERLAQERGY